VIHATFLEAFVLMESFLIRLHLPRSNGSLLTTIKPKWWW